MGWGECVSVKDDMKLLLFQPEWAIFRDTWRDLIWGKRLTLAKHGKKNIFTINDDDEASFVYYNRIILKKYLNCCCKSI